MAEEWLIANEFSRVVAGLDRRGRSPRLRLTHVRSGLDICLDALQLEALVTLSPEVFWSFLDPSGPGPDPDPQTGPRPRRRRPTSRP